MQAGSPVVFENVEADAFVGIKRQYFGKTDVCGTFVGE